MLEQKRVTKQGGWVVAKYVDWGAMITYPPCAAFERVIAAWHCSNAPSGPETFVNQFVSRKLFGLFRRAGLCEIRMSGEADELELAYAGSKHFDFAYSMFGDRLRDFLNPESAIGARIREGVDVKAIEPALQEIELWHGHQDAFHMRPAVIAAGRVG